MTKYLTLTGLSLILIFSSLLTRAYSKTTNKFETRNFHESELEQKDTLSVRDRFFENDNFLSHIKLDFAKATTVVEDTSQLRIVNEECAISIIPDTTWINKQQKEMGENWNEVLSDNEYYEYLAEDTLKKLDIPTFFAPREKRFIKFIKSDKSSFIIDLTKMEDAWGLILFNGEDNPVLWESTDIENEIKEIYKR